MRTIKSLHDLHALRQSKLFTEMLTDYLEEEFLILKEGFDFDDLDEAFTIEYGYMVVWEQGDNLRNLSTVGMKWERMD